MLSFSTESVKENDRVLIFGRCGEDGIIGMDITRRWTNATKSYYNNDKIYDESNIDRPGWPTIVKQQGHVHITVCNNQKITLTLKDLYYNYIIVIVRNQGHFGPKLAYQKSYEIFWLIKQLFIEDISNTIYYVYLHKQLSIIQQHINSIM